MNLKTNSVHPELVEGGLDELQVVMGAFDFELIRFQKYIDYLIERKASDECLIPFLLGTFVCENMVALSSLKKTIITLPRYGILRAAFEAAFKIAYVSKDLSRCQDVHQSSIAEDEKTNNKWLEANVISKETHRKQQQLLLVQRQSIGVSEGAKLATINFTSVIEIICAGDQAKEASWKGMYFQMSGHSHGRLSSLKSFYLDQYSNESDLIAIYGTASQLMGLAGEALTRIYPEMKRVFR